MIPEKTITFKTNHNNKLACSRFIHIQIPFAGGIQEATAIKIITADKSHPPVSVRIIDSVHQKLSDLSSTFIHLSHGMDPEEFISMLHKDAPAIKPDTELAVYFYKKNACLAADRDSQNNNNIQS